MRTSLLAALCSLTLLLSAAAAGAQGLDAFAGTSGTIDIAGGTAHIPVMKEAARRIRTRNPAVRITVAGGGSGVGVQKLGEGLVDIGNTGRALTAREVARYGLISFPFALDGVAVVVHPDNPVTRLTSSQVQDIFAGRVVNWKAVGGRDAAIHLYTRDEASGTREVFWKRLLQNGLLADRANVVPSNGAMKIAIAGDENGIGYVSIGHMDSTVKAPALDGVVPTQEQAMSGRYPVTRRLYMNTRGAPQGLVADFIAYILGPEGQEITRASGYIPIP